MAIQLHTSEKDLKHEQRKIYVCPIDGISSGIRVSEVRREIQRKIQSQEFLVHGSVSDNGVCSTHLQRKSSGHCNMSGCRGGKTLSHGNTQKAVFALDSTTIDICLSLFPWAKFRKHKGAVKLHTLLDVRSAMSQVIYISENRTDRI